MNKATREKIADDIIKAATAQNVKMSKNYKNGILHIKLPNKQTTLKIMRKQISISATLA